MLKLKKLLKESFGRKFGEPLATLDSVMKDHKLGKLYTEKDRPPFKTSKQIEEEKLDEGVKRVNQKTRFGTIEIVHAENPTGPGYDPEYVIDVKIGGNYLASILIEGDPRDNPYKAKVKVQTHKKNIKVKV
jgi:hypothetical protein